MIEWFLFYLVGCFFSYVILNITCIENEINSNEIIITSFGSWLTLAMVIWSWLVD